MYINTVRFAVKGSSMPANDNAFKVMLQYHPEQFVQWLLP
jgi:hypothetical protein